MMISKVLKALNDTLELELPEGFNGDANGTVAIEYGSKGDDGVTASAGAVRMQGTITGDVWDYLTINKSDDTSVTNLAASGLGWVDNPGWTKVRAILTGGASAHGVMVTLNSRTP